MKWGQLPPLLLFICHTRTVEGLFQQRSNFGVGPSTGGQPLHLQPAHHISKKQSAAAATSTWSQPRTQSCSVGRHFCWSAAIAFANRKDFASEKHPHSLPRQAADPHKTRVGGSLLQVSKALRSKQGLKQVIGVTAADRQTSPVCATSSSSGHSAFRLSFNRGGVTVLQMLSASPRLRVSSVVGLSIQIR